MNENVLDAVFVALIALFLLGPVVAASVFVLTFIVLKIVRKENKR